MAGLTGCVVRATPAEHFTLSPEAPKWRAAQTRIFETADIDELLSASAAVLQDLGFHVVESERELGFLRGTKERSARSYSEGILRGLMLAATLGRVWVPVDLQQRIGATVVVMPVEGPSDLPGVSRLAVRVSIHRAIWQGAGQTDRTAIPPGSRRLVMVRDPEIYQTFFARLSKAVFLEAYTL